MYNKSFKLYVKGNWEGAKIGFIKTLMLCPRCNDMDIMEAEELIN